MPDFYLPSLYSENITGLGIALDISASVSKQEFTTYITEVASIKDTLKPLTTDVLTFDTQISEIHTLGLDDSVEDIEFVGGGGTDLHPVFNYFNNNSPTVLIVFSDLECAPIMDTPEYDVIWIIVNNPTAKTNFGIDIHYSTKDL
jgi:predicted metal-dependent peptidase